MRPPPGPTEDHPTLDSPEQVAPPSSSTGLPLRTPPRRTLLIAGGYSSGHVTPGFAIAAWAREALPGVEVRFVGSDDGPEGRWIREAGYDFLPMPVRTARYRGITGGVDAALRFAGSTRRMLRVLREDRVGLVVALGSYASVAPIAAAHLTKTPLVVFEANAFSGMANRFGALRARHVFVTELWEGDPADVVPAALPLRQEFLQPPPGRAPLAGRPLRILVLGGSLGHGFLNRHAWELAGALVERGVEVEVRHQCGLGVEPAAVEARYREVGVAATVDGYWDDIGPHYRWADLAVTAAGSVTLHELAAQRLPAAVVPLSVSADDHQTRNAARFAEGTGAIVQPESGWDPARLADRLRSRWSGDEELEEARAACARWIGRHDPASWQHPLSAVWEATRR